MAALFSSEKEQEAQLQNSVNESKQGDRDDEDPELIFVGMYYIKKDAKVNFVRMTSNSKPVISNILNRAHRQPHAERKKGYSNQGHALQPGNHGTLTPKDGQGSSPEVMSADDPVRHSSASPGYTRRSPHTTSHHCSDLLSPRAQHVVTSALSLDSGDQTPHDSKQVSAAEVMHTSSSDGQCEASFPQPCENGKTHLNLKNSVMETNTEGLPETGSSRGTNQHKAFNSKKEKLNALPCGLHTGQHGDMQPEQKAHAIFKCLSCKKALKNIKFMNHMKHHLELQRQRGDSWDNHTTCQHCHRRFPTPFQLQSHIECVHITSQEPSFVCKICELSFETDQVLLQHMVDLHKPNEMPYVCQICKYKSLTFREVEAHFSTCHENTKSLLCLFCLKVFKTSSPYMKHCLRHWSQRVSRCSKCRLQFLTKKEKIEHETKNH